MKSTYITNQLILVSASGANCFVKFPDIFEKYRVKTTSDKMEHDWFHNPMQFWQNQLHFAIWCAQQDVCVSPGPGFELNMSVLSFHVYYQIRRILKEISAPLSQDPKIPQIIRSIGPSMNVFVRNLILLRVKIGLLKDLTMV